MGKEAGLPEERVRFSLNLGYEQIGKPKLPSLKETIWCEFGLQASEINISEPGVLKIHTSDDCMLVSDFHPLEGTIFTWIGRKDFLNVPLPVPILK